MQTSGMTEKEREAFLERFEAGSNITGFCVMGGIFAEGIDLREERLIGAVIVGTGLPQVGEERELIKRWFDKHEKNGFDHAYLYPGMNKVLQAAGRVIRTEEDTGIIALLDERFDRQVYRSLFPREWIPYKKTNISCIDKNLSDFWESH